MKISLVVPVYNEEAVIDIFYNAVISYEPLKSYQKEIIFINDGSKDQSSEIIHKLSESDSQVVAIDFSRNFGKEAALFAGLEHATGDITIPIDVDLQDPISVIPLMLEKYQQGAQVVLAKRIDRTSDSWFKRKSAEAFYWVHNKMSNPKIEANVGDFRLMSRMVVEAVIQMPERQLFMKGVLSWVGFKTEVVEYTRDERIAGDSKFNGWKLWNFALEGITSFSTVPLRVWSYLGAFIASIAFIYAIFILLGKLIYGNPVSGYASIMCAVLFLGGIQLIGIGVLGEYLGRIYIETKQRPKYIKNDVRKERAEKPIQ